MSASMLVLWLVAACSDPGSRQGVDAAAADATAGLDGGPGGQGGALDPSFGGGVVVLHGIPQQLAALEALPDGFVLVGGNDEQAVVTRLRPDGSIDLGWGANGSVHVDGISLVDLAILADGRILMTGSHTTGPSRNVAAATLSPDGTIEGVYAPAASDETRSLRDIAPRPSGDAIVVQTSGATATLSVVVGASGPLPFDAGLPPLHHPERVALDGGGRVVSAGTVSMAGVYADRALPDGGEDPSFTPSEWGGDAVSSVAIDATDRIVVATHRGQSAGLSRLQADGSGDASFVPGASLFGTASIALTGDGAIVIASALSEGSPTGTVVTRLRADGAVDTSFGDGGQVELAELPSPALLVLQADERIVVAAQVFGEDGYEVVVARLLP